MKKQMREIPIEIPGFEGRNLKVVDNGISKPIQIFIDGKKVGRKGFKFLVTDNEGKEAEIKFMMNFLFDMGKVSIRNQEFVIKSPLRWYQYLWADCPLLMIFVGGAIGGALGGGAAAANTQIFRSKMNSFLKYLTTAVISVSAVTIWIVIAIYLNRTFNSQRQ
jgi:hypothetical protein